MTSQISEAFLKSCQLLHKAGFRDIAKEGRTVSHKFMDWEFELDSIAMQIKLQHKGFPCGVFSPSGGAMIDGSESDFIRDLDLALESKEPL